MSPSAKQRFHDYQLRSQQVNSALLVAAALTLSDDNITAYGRALEFSHSIPVSKLALNLF